jgi:hypothetical protein
VERLRNDNGAFPTVCFACSARVFIDGEYSCDPNKLDNRDVIKSVARYRPQRCPRSQELPDPSSFTEIALRKILKR